MRTSESRSTTTLNLKLKSAAERKFDGIVRSAIMPLLLWASIIGCDTKESPQSEPQTSEFMTREEKVQYADSINMLNLRDAVRDSSNWNRFVLTQFLHDTLPKDLFSLTELEILHITFTYLERIPEEMCALTNLSILALARNKLRNIDNIVCLQNLRSLDLLGNKLTSIPENFKDLDRLEYLDLSNNNFAAGLKGSLPESLVEIRLVNCNIQSFPQELLSLNTIRTVYLANNPELKTIPASIQNLTEMEELVLSGTGLSSDQIQDLRRMLPNCQIFFEPAR